MTHEYPPLRVGHPIWLGKSSEARQSYPSFKGCREADVVVVGGGMTGALIALAFAAEDISVILMEGALAGRGSSAASSALLLQEPDQGMAELAARYGARTSRQIWQASHEAVRDFVAMLGRLHIQCDLEKRDAVYYATHPESADRLRREFRLRCNAGFEGDWLTPGALRRLTGIPGRGAIRTRGSAQFNPYRACVGLLRAAATSGAEIFERSSVTRVDVLRNQVRVHTRQGTVDARRVIVATGYATSHFRPLAGRFRMHRTYVLATRPLSVAQRRELGLPDVMIWDSERPYHYARWTADHRLLLGGADRPVRRGQRRRAQFVTATRQLRADFEAILPALGTIDVDAAWEGLFAMTPDSLPYIGPHRRYPGHWFALGYGGNAMTFGFLAAQLLLERWQGAESRTQQLFRFSRLRTGSP